MLNLIFYKRIKTVEHSIFYSLINNDDNTITGYGRQLLFNNVGDDYTKQVTLDDTFTIIEDNDIRLKCEDPRVFIHNGIRYVVDNFFCKIRLYDTVNKKYIPVRLPGKNFSFISHNNELYFIYIYKPFLLFKINLETTEITQVEVDNLGKQNLEYRGGTPGYKLSDNIYYGYGHRTYNKGNVLLHDIFYWTVDFNYDNPHFEIVDIPKPKNALNISDPTCVIEVNNKMYLITAESEKGWEYKQDYVTNVYEIQTVS
jgi:hypothetical protein